MLTVRYELNDYNRWKWNVFASTIYESQWVTKLSSFILGMELTDKFTIDVTIRKVSFKLNDFRSLRIHLNNRKSSLNNFQVLWRNLRTDHFAQYSSEALVSSLRSTETWHDRKRISFDLIASPYQLRLLLISISDAKIWANVCWLIDERIKAWSMKLAEPNWFAAVYFLCISDMS